MLPLSVTDVVIVVALSVVFVMSVTSVPATSAVSRESGSLTEVPVDHILHSGNVVVLLP